jgi:hypothetical protein
MCCRTSQCHVLMSYNALHTMPATKGVCMKCTCCNLLPAPDHRKLHPAAKNPGSAAVSDVAAADMRYTSSLTVQSASLQVPPVSAKMPEFTARM